MMPLGVSNVGPGDLFVNMAAVGHFRLVGQMSVGRLVDDIAPDRCLAPIE